MKNAIATTDAPAALGPYSQGIDAGGLVFVSGQLPISPATGEVPADVSEQAEQSIANVEAILKQAGLTLADVVKTTVFLHDMGDFAAMNAVYEARFPKPCPARSTVEIGTMPRGCRLEIEAIAAR